MPKGCNLSRGRLLSSELHIAAMLAFKNPRLRGVQL